MKQLNRLIHYSLSDYYSWYTAADSLNLNGSELLKALEEVMDISLRDNISPENIAEILDIGRLVAGQLSSHQKSNRFKKRIEILRYPILNQINQKIVEYLKNFSDEFREIFRVDWDRSLEEPGISFQFRIKDAEDIQKNNNMLMKPEIQQQIMNLMNVIKNIPEQ
ncbi:MAG: hypothetical protein JXL67_06315 [Calditrichaeota bacterium]|nr:hypothetical protein [Calditrichota bacterium]